MHKKSHRWNWSAWCSFLVLSACASHVLKTTDADKLEFSKDFDKVVKIEDLHPNVVQPKLPPLAASAPDKSAKIAKKTSPQKTKRGKHVDKDKDPEKRQPLIEDSEKMIGRRPLSDPFRVGEKITLDLTYFKMSAGELTLEVAPFVIVNGRKAYHFKFGAKSTSMFAVFYAVDDLAETFLDFAEMIPSTYSIHVKESKQIREVRAFWDYQAKQANVWDKRVTKEKGVQEENEKWALADFAQNVFSAIFYMRSFQMYPGKKLAFHVADGGKNYLFRGEVLRREKLATSVGELDTLVIQPKFELDGMFAPVGDILFWVTDDDRKFLVRIESKIKIGTIVGQVKSIEKGI